MRELPSVDRLLQQADATALIEEYGRYLTVEAVRQASATIRTRILNGKSVHMPLEHAIMAEAEQWLEAFLRPTLRPVINATGVIVHTNLGRAPLSQDTLAAITAVSSGYSTLEYDLTEGKRGSRTTHAQNLLTRITNTEAALVVNNNAAAVLLMLTALCRGKEVIISRGQLVEIGGGFRVPDVMVQSGAELVEVGTTNRTHLRDYANAINENTAAILVAHHSNYKIIGFTTEPSLAKLAELAHAHNIPLLFDQGSGALIDTGQFGLDPEPTVLDGLQAGCDIVTFSGDKLLGGPQAGILCGNADLIAVVKTHPLARAVRADKMCLAGLTATLRPYLTQQAITQIPVWQMIAKPLATIETEANAWASYLQSKGISAQVMDGRSTVGGGSLPGTTLPTKVVAIEQPDLEGLATALRHGETAVIGRIQNNQFAIDPRTVLPEQVEILLQNLVNCLQ
ncbi:MAG: L-seryl-tRNA(Sec) selenium transferase [Anaerolineales bacterium]|nr:L-seryl-tRNA(Sec) selenium transferase [Anaerolineales bacterium]